MKATAGRVLEPLVSFERYSEEYGGSREENRKEYDETVLLEGYEVVTAPQRGAQVCDGDSGGPLLRPRGATFEVVGVASYVLATPLKPCTFGAVYTTFGPKARRLVERETR